MRHNRGIPTCLLYKYGIFNYFGKKTAIKSNVFSHALKNHIKKIVCICLLVFFSNFRPFPLFFSFLFLYTIFIIRLGWGRRSEDKPVTNALHPLFPMLWIQNIHVCFSSPKKRNILPSNIYIYICLLARNGVCKPFLLINY